MRITRKVFHDLAIWMIGFGLTIGVVFPFFMLALGVPSGTALTPLFFGACLGAGAVVGGINYCLAKQIVGSRRHPRGACRQSALSGQADR